MSISFCYIDQKKRNMKSLNRNTSEADCLGRFLLNLYHARIFDGTGRIEKATLIGVFVDNKEVIPLLRKHEFLDKSKCSKNGPYVFVDMTKLLRYRESLLELLDGAQKREIFKSSVEEFKKEDKLQIDPNWKQDALQFKGSFVEHKDENFILTSKGCFICQKNFGLESDYIEHIEYHNQESNFKSLRSRNPILTQFALISYQMCQNSAFLRVCIQSVRGALQVLKVVIVRSNSMLYPQEADTPYILSAGEQSFFYIDCHTFEIGYEQPVVLVFQDEVSKNLGEMRVEQHHFVRMEPFNVEISSALSVYVPKRGELLCKAPLKDYFPPTDLKENDISKLYVNYPKLPEYLLQRKVINQENIEDIFKLLLQLEDAATLNMYKKLTQKKAFVNWSGIYFSVWLTIDNAIVLEDILKEGDRIELTRSVGKNGSHPIKQKNDQAKANKIFGYVERILNRRVFFSVKQSKLVKLEKQYDIKFHPTRYHVILQYRAIELLKRNSEVKKILFPERRTYANEAAEVSIEPHNKSLAKNPEQLEAVERIVHYMDSTAPYIIFGPPGTGKTTTVVEAIYQLWRVNPTNKILVVGGSNSCVDEIAIRLLRIFKEIDPYGKNLLRVYSSAQAQKLESVDDRLIKVSNLCHGYQFYPNLEILYMYRIVLTTLSVAARYVHGGLAQDNFSHVFVDECGATTEPEVISVLIGTVTAKTKVVLAGDPKQLGPVLKSKTAENFGLDVSLLERLMNLDCYQNKPGSNIYDRSRQMRLIKNYRSHQNILRMSNKLYYKSKLEACGKTDVTSWALNWYKFSRNSFPVIFHSVKGKTEKLKSSYSLHNLAEVRVVMNYIKELMYFGVNGRKIKQRDIGVVTPYKSQVNLIKMELDTRKWFEIEVGSVEKFQGQERPVIILSMVRSQTEGLGFLVSPKRLNVSLTRAQAVLIIIGNAKTLSINSDFKYIIDYCASNGGFVEEKSLLLSSCNTSGIQSKNMSISKQKAEPEKRTLQSVKQKSQAKQKQKSQAKILKSNREKENAANKAPKKKKKQKKAKEDLSKSNVDKKKKQSKITFPK